MQMGILIKLKLYSSKNPNSSLGEKEKFILYKHVLHVYYLVHNVSGGESHTNTAATLKMTLPSRR